MKANPRSLQAGELCRQGNEAARRGDSDLLSLAISHACRLGYAEPPTDGSELGRALREAARRGDGSAVVELLGEGAGGMVGSGAAEHGHAAVVSALLAAGADVNKGGASGWTALKLAAGSGYAAGVALLLAAGARVNEAAAAAVEPPGPARWTAPSALILAAQGGHAAAASVLLAAGAAVDAVNLGGATALLLAARDGHTPVVSLLLAAGAAVGKADAATKRR